MLNYFGEKADSFCGNCGNCLKQLEAQEYQQMLDKNPLYDAKVKLKKPQPVKRPSSQNPKLYDSLRLLRNRLAKESSVPAYVIFTDKTIKEMSMYLPMNKEQMMQISGVGEVKYEKYGARFLAEIKRYRSEEHIDETAVTAHAKIRFSSDHREN